MAEMGVVRAIHRSDFSASHRTAIRTLTTPCCQAWYGSRFSGDSSHDRALSCIFPNPAPQDFGFTTSAFLIESPDFCTTAWFGRGALLAYGGHALNELP
jgi:hypothetical protein